MPDMKRFTPTNPSLDLDQILQEAQNRWLRPAEICEILRNYQKFYLTPDPPVRPPAGSLFLFDRKVLRYFRKDGHRWRKKRDGKTVKEAHEKLKAGSVDVLHCYYAHGEDNESFQRRSYWMLDEQLEHIVLVHYREVKEGYKLGVSRLLNSTDQRSQIGSTPISSLSCPHSPTVQESHVSSSNIVDWNEQMLSSAFEGKDSEGDRVASISVNSIKGSTSNGTSFHAEEGFPYLSKNLGSGETPTPSFSPAASISTGPDAHRPTENLDYVYNQKLYFEQLSMAEILSHKLLDARLDTDKAVQDASSGGLGLGVDARAVDQECGIQYQLPNHMCPKDIGASAAFAANNAERVGVNSNETGELEKLDSFGRWMDKEIGRDCDDSLMASDSGNYWNTLDAGNDDKEVSSLSRHMQFDTDSLGPSLSQEQLFSISEFAPDWAYSGVETKVLIIGTFLGDKHSSGSKWCCMFGEIEVSAEVLVDSVIRCQVPFHAPGHVPFYITCSNRLACSEVREFEFRENPSGAVPSVGTRNAPEDEMCLQIQLTKMLNIDLDRKWFNCTAIQCDKCKLKVQMHSMKGDGKNSWDRFEDFLALFGRKCVGFRDVLIENLLRDRLYNWLVCKAHEGGKGPHILDDQGLGIIHLVAALGYVWALRPIVAAGVSPNFRDARGRTALHWASYYGREETVIALVRLDAAAGAVDDPTPAYPGGRTAADMASNRGHKGIAGYLAEADLISHLRALNVSQDDMGSLAASAVADKALETAVQEVAPLHRALDKEVALKGSLAAVRKSAHAAALIQAAFRTCSFRQRQLANSKDTGSEVSVDLVTLGSLNKVQKINNFEDYLHSAAIKIQQKYRGWKGRKEFVKIRNRIVKIQAHVRGHQVRKQYKKVVWSVSIVEKAILRWRRKKHGLRGFRAGKISDSAISELEKNDEYEFLRIGRKQKFAGVEKALARVRSMVRHPDARDQYMRLVAKFENCQINDQGS